MTCKKIVPDMTCNVFGGTLNLAQSINQSPSSGWGFSLSLTFTSYDKKIILQDNSAGNPSWDPRLWDCIECLGIPRYANDLTWGAYIAHSASVCYSYCLGLSQFRSRSKNIPTPIVEDLLVTWRPTVWNG